MVVFLILQWGCIVCGVSIDILTFILVNDTGSFGTAGGRFVAVRWWWFAGANVHPLAAIFLVVRASSV